MGSPGFGRGYSLQTADLLLARELADALNDVVEESLAYRWSCAAQRVTFARVGPTHRSAFGIRSGGVYLRARS